MSSLTDTSEFTVMPDGRRAVNGHGLVGVEPRSSLLAYLPAIFSEGDDASFIGRYLMIFETLLKPLDNVITHLPDYFTPQTAPESFLPWLASWVGLTLDEAWPLERRRIVLAHAIELYRRRGTVRGLTEHILLYTGYRPTIDERAIGLRLGKQNRLGHQTVLGRGDRPHHFSVVLRVPDPSAIDRTRLRVIIEAQRPAHTTYALFIVPSDEQTQRDTEEPSANLPPETDNEGASA